jgi:hypothetical protein
VGSLVWIIHERLLRQSILSPGVAFLVRSPRRNRHGSPYQEPAASPSRRRAQMWRALFSAPCALRESHGKARLDAPGGRVK